MGTHFDHPHPADRPPSGLSRRELLGWLSAGAGAAALGGGAWLLDDRSGGAGAPERPTSTLARNPGPVAAPSPAAGGNNTASGDRLLVMIEFAGGNDGLSMVMPLGDGRYHDLRPTLATPDGRIDIPADFTLTTAERA